MATLGLLVHTWKIQRMSIGPYVTVNFVPKSFPEALSALRPFINKYFKYCMYLVNVDGQCLVL